MNYLNVSLTGLRGRHHPALANIVTTREVQKCRIHIKMLSGDYYTYQVKADQSGGSPHCRCCTLPDKPAENISHILTSCSAYEEIRNRVMTELENLCRQSQSNISFQTMRSEPETLCQFILDPSSFNLSDRIHRDDPVLLPLFKLSRDLCYGINSERMKILKKRETSGGLDSFYQSSVKNK